MTSAFKLGIQGMKVRVSGRLAGAEIARSEWYAENRVPLHTLRANIDYGFAEANTTFGKIGVKVWIYKGDALDYIEARRPVSYTHLDVYKRQDQERLALSLQKLAMEDPSFRVHTDEETGQTIIAGMGELHLEIIVDRLLREFKVDANVGKPQVAYRETVSKRVKQEGKYIKQSGGRGQYGHCWIELEPLERGAGYEFVNKVVGGAIPKEFVTAIDKGIKAVSYTHLN